MPRTTLLFPALLCLAALALLEGSAQAERLRPDGGSTLRLHNAAGAPTTGCCVFGAQVIDTNGDVWLCTVGDCPGTWAAMGGAGLVGITAGGTASATWLIDTDSGTAAGTTALELDAGDGAAVQTASLTHDGAAGTFTLALPGGTVAVTQALSLGAGLTLTSGDVTLPALGLVDGYDLSVTLDALTTGTTGAATVTQDGTTARTYATGATVDDGLDGLDAQLVTTTTALAAASGTTAQTYTVNSDATGTANANAGITLRSDSLGLGVAGDFRLVGALDAASPGLAAYVDDVGGSAIDAYLYVGKPGDFTAAGDNVEAGIKLRSHAAGDAIGTAKLGEITQLPTGVLTISGAASVTVSDPLHVEGAITLTGTVDGYDVGTVFGSLTTGTTGAAAVTQDGVTARTYATGATVDDGLDGLDAQLVTATAAASTAQGDATQALSDASTAQSAAGTADALAESVATDRQCYARAGLLFDGTGNDISFALDRYDSTDREVYAVGTDGTGAQDASLVQQACVPQRDPLLAAARVTYKVTGTMQVVLTVVDSGGATCATSAAGTSATKAALSAGDTSTCTTTAGELLTLVATCSGGAAADTCSIGHPDVAWAR